MKGSYKGMGNTCQTENMTVSSEHTPGGGQPFLLWSPGGGGKWVKLATGGLVPCSRGPQLRILRVEDHAVEYQEYNYFIFC